MQAGIEKQKQMVRELVQNGVEAAVQLDGWKKSLELKELDRGLLVAAVEQIRIFENRRIEIVLRYEDVITKLKVIQAFFEEEGERNGKNIQTI